MNDKIVKICNDLCESRDSKLIFYVNLEVDLGVMRQKIVIMT